MGTRNQSAGKMPTNPGPVIPGSPLHRLLALIARGVAQRLGGDKPANQQNFDKIQWEQIMTTLQSTREGPGLKHQWRQQVACQLRRRSAQGVRDLAAISWLQHGRVGDGLLDLQQLVFTVLHDEVAATGPLPSAMLDTARCALPGVSALVPTMAADSRRTWPDRRDEMFGGDALTFLTPN